MLEKYKFELQTVTDKLIREILQVKPGETVVITADTCSNEQVVNTTAASVHSAGGRPMVIWISTPSGVGKAADKDLPLKSLTVVLENLATTLVKEFNGYFLFKGIVSAVKWEDKDGFTYGDLYVDGEDGFSGDTFKIWIQNENIISWKNDKIYVTVPDSINIIDDTKNMPLLNPDAKVGDRISIFALKSFNPWRTEKGMEVFGPKFFGYDIEYRPIEDIMNSSD